MKKLVLFFTLMVLTLAQVGATETTFLWDPRNETGKGANMTKIFAGDQMIENLSKEHPVTVSHHAKDNFKFWPAFNGGYGEEKFKMLEMNQTYMVLIKGDKDHYELIINKLTEQK